MARFSMGTLALAGLFVSGSAAAGGFEVPDNGAKAIARGAAFTAKADDGTALEHNPGALANQRGFRLTLSHNTLYAPATFTRAKSSIPQKESAVNGRDPLAPVSDETPWFALGGFLCASHDFGLDGFTFAAGLYGPNAKGQQRWSKNGGQRYMLTELDVLLVYYSLAIAYGKKDEWGAGITLQAAHQPKTRLSLVVDGVPGGPLAPYYAPNDVESTIDLSAPPVPTAVLGLWWRPLPSLELGASGRPLPVKLAATGDVTLANMPAEWKSAQFSPDKLEIDNSAARLTLTLPPYARVGARYRGMDGDTERFDVELDLVWEGWSVIDKYQVELDGTIKLFAKAEAPDVVIEKRWKDTLSARVGGTYNLPALPLSLSAGGYYETGAVPNDYTHLDFPSFDRVGLGAGVGYKVGKADLQASYLHVFQEPRTVSEQYGRVYQQRPVAPCPQQCKDPPPGPYDGVPANAGTLETSFDLIGVSASIGF